MLDVEATGHCICILSQHNITPQKTLKQIFMALDLQRIQEHTGLFWKPIQFTCVISKIYTLLFNFKGTQHFVAAYKNIKTLKLVQQIKTVQPCLVIHWGFILEFSVDTEIVQP